MMISLLTACLLCVEPVVLENAVSLRVEVDPLIFSIRFLGFSGGQNFVDPLYVTDEERQGDGWLDPGGLVTDLIPSTSRDAALRRGPAEVVSRDRLSVVLLGPPSAESGIRLRKEIRLSENRPELMYKVTALTEAETGVSAALRNTVRLPQGSTIRVLKALGNLRPLAEGGAMAHAIVQSNLYWLIPVPPTAPIETLLLGAFVPEISIEQTGGLWTRRLMNMPDDPGRAPLQSTFLAILDDPTRSYGAAFQGISAEIRANAPLSISEEWIFKKRGR